MPSSLLCKPKHVLLWETIVVVEVAAEAVALQDAANLKRQHFENEGGREVSFFCLELKYIRFPSMFSALGQIPNN